MQRECLDPVPLSFFCVVEGNTDIGLTGFKTSSHIPSYVFPSWDMVLVAMIGSSLITINTFKAII